ncbi:lipopolysaccharide biosynthesis protein [Vibrio tapetis]|uniref:Uncharacterized protein n=1 Tax=Vibrio tapetis subsp. tapetis TaxID=1671868 RepID=A0A2N8ZGE9_9VIBR|nr:MATE family efflux transporter [Vibrio tapetis]SON50966.1 conserved membrane protein of unknown function [Vibrio tapetis subsp. tapetis]
MEDSLRRRYLVKLGSSITSGLVNAGILVLVPRFLGPAVFGNYTYLTQMFTQIMALIDAGTSTAFFTKLSANKEKNEIIVFYSTVCLLLFLIVNTAVFCVWLFELGYMFNGGVSNAEIALAALFCFFVWLSQVAIKAADAYALTTSIELVKIIYRIMSLCFLWVLIKVVNINVIGYYLFNIIMLLGFIIGMAVAFYRNKTLFKGVFSVNVKWKIQIKSFFEFSYPIFQFGLVGILFNIFDIWLLQNKSGSIETGFYGLSFSIATLSIIFTASMTPVISREFAKFYGQGNMSEVANLFTKYVPVLFSLSAFIGFFISFNSDIFVRLFAGDEFYNAKYSLMILALYPIHQTFGQLTSSVLFAMNKTKIYKNIGFVFSVLGGLVSVITIYLLNLGAYGLAIKMVLIQLVSVNVQLFFTCRYIGVKFSLMIKNQLICCLILCFIALVSSTIPTMDISPYIDLTIYAVIYGLLSLIVFFIFPSPFGVERSSINALINRVIMNRGSGE